VNSVSPGWDLDRASVDKAAPGGDRATFDPIWGQFHMLGRMGHPIEIAAPVLFLAERRRVVHHWDRVFRSTAATMASAPRGSGRTRKSRAPAERVKITNRKVPKPKKSPMTSLDLKPEIWSLFWNFWMFGVCRFLIMPLFPVVDTHLHIWDLGRLRYPGSTSNALLNRNHLIGGLSPRLRPRGGG